MSQRTAKVGDQLALISCDKDCARVWVLDQPWVLNQWRCSCRRPGRPRQHGVLASVGISGSGASAKPEQAA